LITLLKRVKWMFEEDWKEDTLDRLGRKLRYSVARDWEEGEAGVDKNWEEEVMHEVSRKGGQED